MRLFKRRAHGVVCRAPVLERDDVGAQREDSTVARAADLTQRTNQFNMTTRRQTADEIRELLEVDRRIPRPWSHDAAFGDPFVHEHTGFAVVADADERGHAGIQHGFALVRIEVQLRIPEAGDDELSIGLNALRTGRRRRAFAANGGDAIAADDDLRIAYGRAAVPIDERAAVYDDDVLGARGRLAQKSGGERGRDGKGDHDDRSGKRFQHNRGV